MVYNDVEKLKVGIGTGIDAKLEAVCDGFGKRPHGVRRRSVSAKVMHESGVACTTLQREKATGRS